MWRGEANFFIPYPPTPSTKYSADLQNMPYIPSRERNKTTRDLQCADILEQTALLEHFFL
jgi:hypothetical protein